MRLHATAAAAKGDETLVFNDRLELRGFDHGEEYRRLGGSTCEVDIASRGKVIETAVRREPRYPLIRP